MAEEEEEAAAVVGEGEVHETATRASTGVPEAQDRARPPAHQDLTTW